MPTIFGDAYLENLGQEIHIIDGVKDMMEGLSGYRLAFSPMALKMCSMTA